MEIHPDTRRIERALKGDAAAAGELVELLTPAVQCRVAATLLRVGGRSARGLRAEVEDLTQDVLLSLFADQGKILAAWEPERGLSLQAFVGLVARRQVLSLLRSRRRSPFSQQPIDPADLDNQADFEPGADAQRSSESRQSLEQLALRLQERLSPLGLQMFYSIFVAEDSVSEVSQKTGLSTEAVYQWKSRIKKAALEVQDELIGEAKPAYLSASLGTSE